jgi:hypothetical protein
MKRLIAITTVAAALLLGGTAHAVSNGPALVKLDCEVQNQNPVGQQLCYQLRESVARSASFREVYQAPAFVMHVVSLDPTPDDNGHAAAYSLTITVQYGEKLPEYFMTAYVGVTGASRVQETAQSLMATLSEQKQILAASTSVTSK